MLVHHLLKIIKIEKCRETGNLKHLYRKELDKAYFTNDAVEPGSKNLTNRTI